VTASVTSLVCVLGLALTSERLTRSAMNASNGKRILADGLGEFLRRERELRHISLDDIAERTKISRRYLEAIEEERYDRLPGETFVRGFIRSYAQSIGLDPDDALLIYNHSRMIHDVAPTRTERLSPARRPWNERSLLWLLVVAVVIVGGVLVSAVGLLAKMSLQRWSVAPHSENTKMPSAGGPLILTVTADSDTWLWVTIDGQDPQDMVMRAGQSTKWIGRERFILSVGNARATHLRLNGHDLIIPQPTQGTLRHHTISRDVLP
jgi:transcriptional regulator with XRE-family HTH domain